MNDRLMEALAPGSLRPGEPEERNDLETIENPTGRLDALLYGVAERYVEQSANPALVSAWSRFRNPLAEFLKDNLGPVPKAKRKRKRTEAPVRRSKRRRRCA